MLRAVAEFTGFSVFREHPRTARLKKTTSRFNAWQTKIPLEAHYFLGFGTEGFERKMRL